MKEIKNTGDKPIIQTHYPIRKRKVLKRWTISMSSSVHRQKKDRNENIEAAYMRLLSVVKTLVTPGTTYFEKDSRQDQESAVDMHTYLTPHFYWHLQCNFHYDYEIEFAINNCPYEEKIRYMLRAYPLDQTAKEIELQPSFQSFFDKVLIVQNAAYIHLL